METAGSPTAWVVAFLVGWAMLRGGAALIPILGGLLWFAAVAFGLGALAVPWWAAQPPELPAAARATDPRIVAAVRGCGQVRLVSLVSVRSSNDLSWSTTAGPEIPTRVASS
jgi:hypothetical protein